jgi:hypothetical protein
VTWYSRKHCCIISIGFGRELTEECGVERALRSGRRDCAGTRTAALTTKWMSSDSWWPATTQAAAKACSTRALASAEIASASNPDVLASTITTWT